MKLITTNRALLADFLRLVQTYPNIAFAVAWASANTPVFEQLLKNTSRISKGVIGIHFYQTHPDVLDAFTGSERIRFILQPKGVFHPKIYLFWNSAQWEALIGSANLTSGALTNNSEAMVLVTATDGNPMLREQIIQLIEGYWREAASLTKMTALRYREIWRSQQPVLRRLAGEYGKSKTRRSPTDSCVMSMSWNEFVSEVRKDGHHGFKERCSLLQRIQSGFREYTNFASMEPGLRKTIAGLPNAFDDRWAWFGSMKGDGFFHQAVNNNNEHLSLALDKISLHGTVLRAQYDEYLGEFIKAFPNGRHRVGIASRLLALKRPDQFVCFDSKNKRELCKDFGIKQSGMDYERYWEEIVERIMDSPWWKSPRPSDDEACIIWDGRAAMLDAIFYRP